jgi:hypothetical protein
MRRTLFVALAVLLVVTSLAVVTRAQTQGQSPIQACVALGYNPDVCATCLLAGITHDAQDYGPCFCKFQPGLLDKFKNMGDCVKWVNENMRPAR